MSERRIAILLVLVLGLGLVSVAFRAPAPHPAAAPVPTPSPSRPAVKQVVRPPKPLPTPPSLPKAVTPRRTTSCRHPAAARGTYAVRGRLVDRSGRPVPCATVTIARHVDTGETVLGAFAVLFSFGLACKGNVACEGVKASTAVTDRNGRFLAYAREGARVYDLTATTPYETVATQVYVDRSRSLNPVTVWSPYPRTVRRGTDVVVAYDSPPVALGTWRHVDVTATRAGEYLPMLAYTGGIGSTTFDARLLEDRKVTLAASVSIDGVRYTGTTTVRGTQRPLSRGATCLMYGNARVDRKARCPLTDGAFGEPWATYRPVCRDYCEPAPGVDLGRVRPVRFVAMRQCYDADDVQVSADGRTWRTFAVTPSDPTGPCTARLTGSARYVRVRGDWDVTEISVF